MQIFFCYLFKIFLYIINIKNWHCNEFKLSDSKVLLPRTSYLSINYTIKGSPNICHEWISETPEVVLITPIFDQDGSGSKCSRQAVITSVWQSNTKMTGTVYAKNIASGHSVKCDVIIDIIKKLEIETRTLELYLHETPEALIAKAYDEYGNTFSTLDGIPFEWLIHASGSNGDAQNVLRFITWTESEYSIPHLIGNLEQQGLQGYMQLVSGLKTGAANVSLTFRDEKIKTYIKSVDVRLLVMANAALSPALAYLIPHTQLTYKIIVHSQGSPEEVKLPNSQYYLKINNSELAELDAHSSTITAKKYGQTEVTLIDKNINEDFRHPSSIIYVVEPGFLTFHISPSENVWVLQTVKNNIYTITVRPFDFNSHPIFMSDNIRLETSIPKKYFEILYSSPNGTYNIVKAIKEGQTMLKSKMMFILLPNGTQLKLDSPVEGTQDLIIFPPIVVIPSSVVLPWYPLKNMIPGFLLTATGGSGEYKWMIDDSGNLLKSSNESVSVDTKGYIKPLKPGLSNIIAADQRNINNRGISKITVSIIRKLHFLLDRVEVEVTYEINLPIMATDATDSQMSHCHWLPFKATSEDTSSIEIVQIISPKHSNISEACALLKVRGIKPGFSKITISLLNLQSKKGEHVSLTASITVGSYRPTKFIDPSSGSSTIGVRSIRTMNIVDGPLPWVLDPSRYFYEMHEDIKVKSIIDKLSLTEPRSIGKLKALLLKVQCLNIGEVDISVTIGNKPSLKNSKPVISIGSIKLICTIPVRVKLVPKLILANISAECPYKNTSENQHLTINNKNPLPVEIIFTDKNGIQLERSESFHIKVEIKSLTKKNIKDIVAQPYPEIIYPIDDDQECNIKSSKFNISPRQPGQSVGEIEVSAKINSYRDKKGPALNLEAKLHLQITKSMIVYPEKILLYHHEKVSARFSIKFGSGYFIVTSPTSEFLQINKLDDLKKVDEITYEVVQTKIDFSHRNGIVNIIDACFISLEGGSENSKSIEIELVKPFKLQLFSLNRVQLGSQINVLLKIYDDTGREFPHDALHILNFDLNFNDNSNFISVHSLNSKEWFISPNEYSKSSGYIFKINGEKLGFDSIVVKLRQNTNIMSNVLKIEVFPPLKLVPKYTVLLEGAEIQLSSTGGPQNSHELLHYHIIKNITLKNKEANIEFVTGPNGLIKAINHGTVSVGIQVEVSDTDPTRDNEVVVLSKDNGRVGVVQIKGLSIWSPTKHLLVGNTMPLWISFTSSSNDLQHLPVTGFSLTGLKDTDMSFKWHLNPPQGVISKLENILEPAGINIGNKYLHSGMRMSSLNSGKQSIEVTVSGIPAHWLSKETKHNLPLIAKLNVAVIPKLEMVYPTSFVKTILLPPSTRITLKSSLDGLASIAYTLIPYQNEKISSKTKSKIHSDNILETNPNLSGNEVENFFLHITSSQAIKLHSENEILANQTVAIFVTVKHPTYSMLIPYITQDSLFKKFQNTKMANKYSNIFVLPLGGPFEFRITNHDEFGTVFDISPDTNMFSYRMHRSDNIAVTISAIDSLKKSVSLKENHSLNNEPFIKYIDTTSFSSHKIIQFQGLATGDNTMQLFYHDLLTEFPQLIDIVCIPTGSVLTIKNYPHNFATEGSRFRYEAPFDNGYWYSSDREIVTIDSISGEAILKKRGTSNIFYSLLNNYPNFDKFQNKNVLISKELVVHSASQLSIKLFDGSSLLLDDPCSKNECIPINFNYQSNSLISAVYISSSSISDYQIENNFKFEKEYSLNISQQLHNDIPVECDIGFDTSDDSIMNLQDLYVSLFKISVLPLSTEFDERLGAKQWGCYILANSIYSLSREELTHLILASKLDLKLKIKTRLRYSSVKSASISVPVVIGYLLLMTDASRTNVVIKESGEVVTSIRLALPMATKNLIDDSRNIKLTVTSSRPNLLEVLAPRQDGTDSGIWIYPLKAVVVDKVVNEQVEVMIEFPLTKQRDVIHLQIDIRGKSSNSKTLSSINVDGDESELSQVNWFTPVLCVFLTAFLAIGFVMLVNQFFQPKLSDDKSMPSPIKDVNYTFSGNYPYSPLNTSPRYTQHIWNTVGNRRDNTPLYSDYALRSKRFPQNANMPTFSDFQDGFKTTY